MRGMWTMSVPMLRGNGKGRGFILGSRVIGRGVSGVVVRVKWLGWGEVVRDLGISEELFEVDLGSTRTA
jgi:hypothetical protein